MNYKKEHWDWFKGLDLKTKIKIIIEFIVPSLSFVKAFALSSCIVFCLYFNRGGGLIICILIALTAIFEDFKLKKVVVHKHHYEYINPIIQKAFFRSKEVAKTTLEKHYQRNSEVEKTNFL